MEELIKREREKNNIIYGHYSIPAVGRISNAIWQKEENVKIEILKY